MNRPLSNPLSMPERTRVLIIGAGGMLGHRLVHEFCAHAQYDVHGTVRSPVPEVFAVPAATYHSGVDLAFNTESARAILQRVQPGVVINAAGVIKQRSAAADPDITMFVNGAWPHILGIAANEIGARLIHVSTDCVYTGNLPDGAYSERVPPDALDVYGRSKAVGEVAWGSHLTLRTSIIGFELSNHLGFVGWLFSNPAGETVQGYERAVYSGLPTPALARTIRYIIQQAPGLTGLYHVASEPISKYELVNRLNSAFGLGLKVVADRRVVCNRALDDSRFREATSLDRPGWDELIAELHVDHAALPYGQAGYRSGALPAQAQ
jgi:dTDP-4-dehydrorhamnose reductase